MGLGELAQDRRSKPFNRYSASIASDRGWSGYKSQCSGDSYIQGLHEKISVVHLAQGKVSSDWTIHVSHDEIRPLESAARVHTSAADIIREWYASHHISPEVREIPLNQQRFDELSQQWKNETGRYSSLPKITSNAHYLRLIGYGKDVIPFILRDLQKAPSPWFSALRIITGKQSIGRDTQGDFQKMAEEWISWGNSEGLI